MDIRNKVDVIKNKINNRDYQSDEEYFELLEQLTKISDNYDDLEYSEKLKVYISNKSAYHSLSKGDYQLVQNTIDINLAFAKNQNDKEAYITTYNLAALLNYNLSEYTKALRYFLSGLEVAKEIGDDYNISKILNNIGDLFFKFKEYDTSYKYFLEASSYLSDKKNISKYNALIIFTEFNISTNLLFLNKYNEALEHFNALKEIVETNEFYNFQILESSLSIAINVNITNDMNTLESDYKTLVNSSKYLSNDTMNVFDSYYLAINSFISTNHKEKAETLIDLMLIVVKMINTNKIYLIYYSLVIDYVMKFEPENTDLLNKYYKLHYQYSLKDVDSRNESVADALNVELNFNLTKIKHKEVLEQNNELYKLSNTDVLTSLYNRLYFNKELNRIFSTNNLDVSIIIFDVDNLKQLNDNYGHLYGDKTLVQAAKSLNFLDDEDVKVFRYGGDEFITIITNKPESFTINYIEGVQNKLSEKNSTDIDSNLTFSIGYTYTNSNYSNQIDIIRNADEALYLAKKSGRDNYKKY